MDVTDVAFLTLPSESKIKIKAQERFDIQLKTNFTILLNKCKAGNGIYISHTKTWKEFRGCGDEELKFNPVSLFSNSRMTVLDISCILYRYDLLLGGPWRGGSQKGALLMGGSVRAANKFTVKVQEKKLLSLPH